MKTLVFKSDRYSSGYEEILGHGCHTDQEVEDYAAHFGGSFKVVDAPFDPGEFIPEDQRPPKPDPMPKLTEALKNASPEERYSSYSNRRR
jgi:hypothetical protein